jgi:hypothetical protein
MDEGKPEARDERALQPIGEVQDLDVQDKEAEHVVGGAAPVGIPWDGGVGGGDKPSA